MQISLIVEWSSLSCLNTRLESNHDQKHFYKRCENQVWQPYLPCFNFILEILASFIFVFFRNFETFVTLAILPTRDYSGAIFWLAQRTCNDFTEDFRRNNAPWIFCGQRSNFLFMFNSKDHGWIWTRSQSFRRETSARFGENKHSYCNFHFKPMNIKTIFAVMNTS